MLLASSGVANTTADKTRCRESAKLLQSLQRPQQQADLAASDWLVAILQRNVAISCVTCRKMSNAIDDGIDENASLVLDNR